MLKYRSEIKRFKNKIYKLLKKEEVVNPQDLELITNIISTYLKLIMISDQYDTYKKLEPSKEFTSIMNLSKKLSNDQKLLKKDIEYSFINPEEIAHINNLINNKEVQDLFLEVFSYKNYSPKKEQMLFSLLNDIVYLYFLVTKYKKPKSYTDITEADMINFSHILEINKWAQNKIQILFTKDSNKVIVFINNLLNI